MSIVFVASNLSALAPHRVPVSDRKVFEIALGVVDGRMSDLAAACKVSRPAVYFWREKVLSDPPLPITLWARLKLLAVAGIKESRQ